MIRRRRKFNTKRRIARNVSEDWLCKLASRVKYGGNPEHKRNPGDFGLQPPSSPRPDKSLCDNVGVFSKDEALELLREGVKKGLISEQVVGGDKLPQNIWTVSGAGEPIEAQLENQSTATYHGYPIPGSDPFGQQVLSAWRQAQAQPALPNDWVEQ